MMIDFPRSGTGAGALTRRGFLRLLGGVMTTATVGAPALQSASEATPTERWAELYLPEGEGPFRALVTTSPAGALVPLFTRDAITAMTEQLNPAVDIYGGLAWDRDRPGVALVYRDADDSNPIRVEPDARGLYDLAQIEWAWDER